MDTKELLQSIIASEEETNSKFLETMEERISDALEVRKVELASTMMEITTVPRAGYGDAREANPLDPINRRGAFPSHIGKGQTVKSKTEKEAQKALKSQIKSQLGKHTKPNLPEEAEQIEENFRELAKKGVGTMANRRSAQKVVGNSSGWHDFYHPKTGVKKAVAAKGARNPAAVAAYIGRKKYGKTKFQKDAFDRGYQAARGGFATEKYIAHIKKHNDSEWFEAFAQGIEEFDAAAFDYQDMAAAGKRKTNEEVATTNEAAVAVPSDQQNALRIMKNVDKSGTTAALKMYHKAGGNVNKLSMKHRQLVTDFLAQAGGLGNVSRGAMSAALRKKQNTEE